MAYIAVICVSKPLAETGSPDLSAVIGAVEGVAAQLQPRTPVSFELTTYPGTADKLVPPILEATGLVADVDIYLAFAPERIDPRTSSSGLETPRR
jgi:UDP-N-acetyl-D-glucosamine dehydrogenase